MQKTMDIHTYTGSIFLSVLCIYVMKLPINHSKKGIMLSKKMIIKNIRQKYGGTTWKRYTIK